MVRTKAEVDAIDGVDNLIEPRLFGDLATNEYFYSPEGSLCRKCSPLFAFMADGEDNCYAVGERVPFRPEEIVEWVPNLPNAH